MEKVKTVCVLGLAGLCASCIVSLSQNSFAITINEAQEYCLVTAENTLFSLRAEQIFVGNRFRAIITRADNNQSQFIDPPLYEIVKITRIQKGLIRSYSVKRILGVLPDGSIQYGQEIMVRCRRPKR